MALCRGFAPGLVYGKKRQQRHAQRCGATPEFEGMCVVHLKAAGYSRCATCSAWLKPLETCGTCPKRPALPMVGTAVEEGIIDWSRDKELDPPLDSRAVGDEELRQAPKPPLKAPACPWCEVDTFVQLRKPSAEIWHCAACDREFQIPF